MVPSDIRLILRKAAGYALSDESRWYKACGLSLLVNLVLMPLVFLFIMPQQSPAEPQPVFMLSGGLQVNWSEGGEEPGGEEALLDDEDEDEEEVEEEDLEDEDMEIEQEVLNRLAKEREDIFSIPSHGSGSIAYVDIDEEDEELEDDEDTEVTLLDSEAEDMEEETLDNEEEEEEEENPKEEVKAAQGEEEGGQETAAKTSWEDIFAKKHPKTSPSSPPKTSEADKKIESLMAVNPYAEEGVSSPPAAGTVTGSFFGEGEAQLPDLLVWLPPDIKLAGLISLSLLRSRPDREVFETTFQKLPYFDTIATGSDLEFFQQLDAVLIASNDPSDVRETYLMLRHNQDEKMIRKAVSKHFAALGVKPNWYRISGIDVVQPSQKSFETLPWIYFFPQEKVVGIVHIDKRDSIKTILAIPGSGKDSPAHLIGPLERLLRFGAGMPEGAQEDGKTMPPGVVVGSIQFDQLMGKYQKNPTFPLPVETIIVGRIGQEAISVEGMARFPETDGPQKFIDGWKTTLEPLRKNKISKLLGIDKLLDFPVWQKHEDGSLTLQALVPSERVGPLLALIRLITGAEKSLVEANTPGAKKDTAKKPPEKKPLKK
jgi:hypothetical protein